MLNSCPLPGNYYESIFVGQIARGRSAVDAARTCVEAFLDGKPKCKDQDRQQRFWSSGFLAGLPADAWLTGPMALALYLGQERYASAASIEQVAAVAPEAVRRAAKCSGLVLLQHSPRWREIESLRRSHPAEYADLVGIFDADRAGACVDRAIMTAMKYFISARLARTPQP